MKLSIPVSLALALALPLGASAASPANPATTSASSEMQSLRQEIAAMRADYEARLKSLEQRLLAAEHVAPARATAQPMSPPTVPAPVSTMAPVTSAEAAAVQPVSTPPVEAAAATGANGFNPAMSLILSGQYTGTTAGASPYSIAGFQLPKASDAGPGTRGFNLSESELGFAASIDPWLRGAANFSLHGDDTVSVEEAYIQTTTLGYGLTAKAGRFLSGVGYLNSHHSHTWDFVDAPLAYQAMLGTQYGDDGVQLSWLAPTDLYLELGAELGRGRSFPGSGSDKNGAGMASLAVHTGGDMGDSHNWRAGVSLLRADAADQDLSAIDANNRMVTNNFTGTTQVWIADGVWKWAPYGNATRTSFKLQGEYLSSTRRGMLSYDTAGANSTDAYYALQSGWYVQGVYQFMGQWRVGLRTEQLNAGTPDYGLNAAAMTVTGYTPSKNSLMLDYNPSEFSRVRLQLTQDRARVNQTDNQVFLQYQMSLGAHGAHGY